MKTKKLILLGFALLATTSSLLFGMSPVRETFYIENLTREEILLTIHFYEKFDLGMTSPSLRVPVSFYDSSGTLIARTSMHRAIQGNKSIPVNRRWDIFDFYISPNRDTDVVSAVDKFLHVVEEFTIKDSAGNTLISLEDLNEDSFITYENSPQGGDVTHVLEIRVGAEK